MAYAVTEACVRCKFMDCVDVCPVDYFYEGEAMIAIKPDECIDCGVCEPECPASAIISDTKDGAERWVAHNRTARWPSITAKGTTPADANDWVGREGKHDAYFSPAPAPR